MNAVVSWVLSILGIVLVGTLVDLLLTKSRLKTFIRSVFATITVLVIVTPLPTLIRSGGSFDFNADAVDQDFIEYASDLKLRTLERAVERALKEDGYDATVTITGKADTDITVESVTINLSENGIPDENEHINKYDVKQRAAALLGIDKDRVTVL